MGIGGLTTYIERNGEVFFELYHLQNCCLVIDGNSIASQIYQREFSGGKRGRCAFGGDYDEYARAVKRFFDQLNQCSVRTIVILDGGREPRKQKTHWLRLKRKIAAGIKASPTNCSECNLPLLMVEVFRSVATQSRAVVAQCSFEADEEVAALSRALSCPLLSYDSDFFLHAVPSYIPFPTLARRLTEEVYYSSQQDRKCVERYITCKVFSVNNFINGINGNWRKKSNGEKKTLQLELLPLIAVLLGNDYVKRNTFSSFMSQIQVPKKSTKSARIIGLLEWLRLEENLDSAIRKILNHAKKGRRVFLESVIRKTVDVYIGGQSELFLQLKLSSLHGKRDKIIAADKNPDAQSKHEDQNQENVSGEEIEDKSNEQKHLEDQQDPIVETMVNLEQLSMGEDGSVDMEENDSTAEGIYSEDSDSEDGSSEESNSENEEDISLSDRVKQLPIWFKERYQRCELPPSFMDIMVRRVYFCPPQIEDASQPHSHEISFPILSAILRLLTPENDEPLSCWTRVGSRAKILSLEPLPKQPSWPLMENLTQTPHKKLVEVLMKAMNLYSTDKSENREKKLSFNSLPADWRILALCLAYWIKFSPGKIVNERHLIAACFSIIVLRVVDERAGPPGKNFSQIRKEKKRQYMECKRLQRSEELKEHLIKSELLNSQAAACDDWVTVGMQNDEIKNVNSTEEKSGRPTVKQLLSSVSMDDCITVADGEGLVFQMRQIDAGPKRRLATRHLRFNETTVHAFAELQSVILHVTHLNRLLGEPIVPSPLQTSFTGTLAYNAHYRAHSKSTISRKQLWRRLLGTAAPSLEDLLEEFYLSVIRLAWGKVKDEVIVKKKRTKKNVKIRTVDENVPKERNDDLELAENQKSFYDPGNKFSLLHGID